MIKFHQIFATVALNSLVIVGSMPSVLAETSVRNTLQINAIVVGSCHTTNSNLINQSSLSYRESINHLQVHCMGNNDGNLVKVIVDDLIQLNSLPQTGIKSSSIVGDYIIKTRPRNNYQPSTVMVEY